MPATIRPTPTGLLPLPPIPKACPDGSCRLREAGDDQYRGKPWQPARRTPPHRPLKRPTLAAEVLGFAHHCGNPAAWANPGPSTR